MQRLELLQDYCHHYFLKTIVSVAVISSQLELEKCRNGRKPDIPGVQNCHDSLTHTQAAFVNFAPSVTLYTWYMIFYTD